MEWEPSNFGAVHFALWVANAHVPEIARCRRRYILFAVSSATGALAKEKRLAFVIGNAAYKTGELATAADDAGLIAKTLQAARFDVVGARDVDQESLRGAFRDFMSKVSTAGPDTIVFVYLAGQGVQFEGENYFVPVDPQITNPADIPLQAMRLSDVTKSLAGLPTRSISSCSTRRGRMRCRNPISRWLAVSRSSIPTPTC